ALQARLPAISARANLMSTGPESEFDLDKMFLPAWAQEPAAAKYAKYELEPEDRPERRADRRGPRGPRPDRRPGPRRDDSRPPGPGPGRRTSPPRSAQRRAGSDERGPSWRREAPERREPPPPLPELTVSVVPDEKGVESLARQIKMTGRAYPLFDIARMILQKPERHSFAFAIKKNAEGQPLQPLFVC